jgi:transcriptional regulator with XRE-family HTH domain
MHCVYEDKIISVIIKTLRENKGIAQDYFAGLLDSDQSAVSRTEMKGKGLSCGSLFVIEKGLELPAGTIFRFTHAVIGTDFSSTDTESLYRRFVATEYGPFLKETLGDHLHHLILQIRKELLLRSGL